jgi:hypothetical protein
MSDNAIKVKDLYGIIENKDVGLYLYVPIGYRTYMGVAYNIYHPYHEYDDRFIYNIYGWDDGTIIGYLL